MGRGKNNGRAQRRKELGTDTEKARLAQAMGVGGSLSNAPEGPLLQRADSVDVATFFQLCCSRSWQEVEAKTAEVVSRGLLTEGLLLAGFTVLEKAKREREDQATVDTIEKLCAHLAGLLQALRNPTVQLVDEWAALLEKDAEAGPEILKRMQEAFSSGRCSQEKFCQEMEQLVERLGEQDKEFEASVEKTQAAQSEGLTEQQKASVEDTRKLRAEGRKRFTQIQELAAGLKMATATA